LLKKKKLGNSKSLLSRLQTAEAKVEELSEKSKTGKMKFKDSETLVNTLWIQLEN